MTKLLTAVGLLAVALTAAASPASAAYRTRHHSGYETSNPGYQARAQALDLVSSAPAAGLLPTGVSSEERRQRHVRSNSRISEGGIGRAM